MKIVKAVFATLGEFDRAQVFEETPSTHTRVLGVSSNSCNLLPFRNCKSCVYNCDDLLYI